MPAVTWPVDFHINKQGIKQCLSEQQTQLAVFCAWQSCHHDFPSWLAGMGTNSAGLQNISSVPKCPQRRNHSLTKTKEGLHSFAQAKHYWTGLEFGKSQRALENREKWRKLVAKSSVVPHWPSRLRDWWWWWWWNNTSIIEINLDRATKIKL